MSGVKMYEIVRVGWSQLIGEISRLTTTQAYIQVYEDTNMLCVGEPVRRTGQALCVELGPGLLTSIFDGIQRPLDTIKQVSGSVFIRKGIMINSLSREKVYTWTPNPNIKVGQVVSGGDVIGTMFENNIIKNHKIMIPPKVNGVLEALEGAGLFNIEQILARVKDDNVVHEIKAYHYWPVRTARPCTEKKQVDSLLMTGQRVLDSLFPAALGGTCAIPGAFGCGKTCVSQAVSKYSNSDVVVYVGCGERGNEMAEVLTEFPELMMDVDGKQESVMLRTVLIANTSNMPVAAREASIYTGLTISEYYRDMGYNVTLLADSTSRWAEALRELSGRLSEMPADSGYPAYLGARLANFYERAGNVSCIGTPSRHGTVTIIGAVSPPGGDFSDPVTINTMNIVQVFWGLDKSLAQRKHFPSVNWNKSHSNCLQYLNDYFKKFSVSFLRDRATFCELLQKENELMEIAQLVGKDSLSEDQQLILFVAKIIREDFLQQNAFSDYDYYCPLYKTAAMMRVISTFYAKTSSAIVNSTTGGSKPITLSLIEKTMQKTIQAIAAMKFLDPKTSVSEMTNHFSKLEKSINSDVQKLQV